MVGVVATYGGGEDGVEVLREVEGGNAGGEGGQWELLVDLGEIPSFVRRRHYLQADDTDHKSPD